MSRLLLLSACLFSSLSLAQTENCPKAFYQVPLLEGASHCRVFNQGTPATLSYHIPRNYMQVISEYKNKLAIKEHSLIRGRAILRSENNHWRLVVSQDQTGSQIDILVKTSS